MANPSPSTPERADAPVRAEAARSSVGRRQLLRGSGLVLAGAAAAVAADRGARAVSAAPAAGRPTPGESLMTEHGVLKRVLLAYSAAATQPASPGLWAAVRTCALIVRDYVEGFHEGLEEAYVFPDLMRAGRHTAVLQTLLTQHGSGRRITTSLLQVTDPAGPGPREVASVRAALVAFVRMYERHEAWEDTVVYPAHRELLGDRRLASLGERIDELERRQLGPRSLTEVLDRLAPAEAHLGTADLAAVTPGPQDLAQ